MVGYLVPKSKSARRTAAWIIEFSRVPQAVGASLLLDSRWVALVVGFHALTPKSMSCGAFDRGAPLGPANKRTVA
jgi:hypothetical protein